MTVMAETRHADPYASGNQSGIALREAKAYRALAQEVLRAKNVKAFQQRFFLHSTITH
jgi:hypothetical protein